jgi:hypothetical protein
VVLLGFAAIAVPTRRLWPGVRERGVFIVIGAFVAALWAIYCAWLAFDSWWFTRFLLSSFPFIMLGLGACADALFRLKARWVRIAVVAAVVALGIAQLQFAWTHTVFIVGHGTRRYAVAADLTRRVTAPNSVAFTLNHSGSIRYYGARMTINIGHMADGLSLDDIVDWLQRRGVRTYAVFEDWELKEFSQRFAGASRLAALKRPPLAVFEDPGQVMVFELSDADVPPADPVVVSGLGVGWRAVPPGPPARLVIGRAP